MSLRGAAGPPEPAFGETGSAVVAQASNHPPSDKRIAVVVVAFATTLVLVGVGAYLLGTGSEDSTADRGAAPPPSGSSAGEAGTPTADASTSSITPAVLSTVASVQTDPAPSTTAVFTPAPSPEATAAALDEPALPTLPVPTAAPAPTETQLALPDNSAAARGQVEGYFDMLRTDDFSGAYAMLSPSFSITFEEYVDYWSVDVARFDAPVDGCNVIGERGVCIVRFFITYSESAGPDFRGRCLAESSELAVVVRASGAVAIDGQRRIEPLSC